MAHGTTPASRQEPNVSDGLYKPIIKYDMASKKEYSHSTPPLITNGSRSSVYGHEPGAIKDRTSQKSKKSIYVNKIPYTRSSNVLLQSSRDISDIDTKISFMKTPHVSFATPTPLVQRPVVLCKAIDISFPLINANGECDLSFMKKELPCWLMYGNDHYFRNLMSLSALKLQTISNQCILQLKHPESQRIKTCFVLNHTSIFIGKHLYLTIVQNYYQMQVLILT